MFALKCAARKVPRGRSLYYRFFNSKAKEVTAIAVIPENVPVRQRLFTGIQPTGALHLGNYLGVVKNWVELQHTKEDAFLCISDMHSITSSKDPPKLRENIFRMAASLMASGIDLQHTTLFVQSAVKEHSQLCWILGSMSSMTNLGHQPMYAEKTRLSHEIPLGIFTYPVMQAADILLYKSTHVPIGEDQTSHIRFAQSLAKSFNAIYDNTFPVFKPITAEYILGRVRCLIDPSKKMSKSCEDPRSAIYISDEPDIIVSKIKDATTDFSSDVRYEPDRRIGISNLIGIHACIVGKTIDEIVSEAASMDTTKYKNVLAEAIIEYLSPIRRKYQDLLEHRDDLAYKLDAGAVKEHAVASETLDEVKQKMGLGALPGVVRPINEIRKNPTKAVENDETVKKKRRQIHAYAHVPVVPRQQIRGEKAVQCKMAAILSKY